MSLFRCMNLHNGCKIDPKPLFIIGNFIFLIGSVLALVGTLATEEQLLCEQATQLEELEEAESFGR